MCRYIMLLILVIAISVSLDSFLTGLVFGLKKVKVSFASFITMALLFLLYCLVGHSFALSLLTFGENHPYFLSFLRLIGKISLIIIGLFFLFEKHKEKKSSSQTFNILNDPCRADIDHSGSIDILEAVFLTLALSVDTVIAVVSVVITGTTGLLSSLLFGAVQTLFLIIGLYSGIFLSGTLINQKLDFIKSSPGYLLIFAGILRIFFN